MDNSTTEKIYCFDRPNHTDSALWATLAQQNRQDPMAMAALMGGGGMGNGMWNNPLIYLVWTMFAGRMFGNNGFGNGEGNNLQAQLDSLRTQMSDNHNSDLVMAGIRGNEGAIRELASTLNCDFNALQGAICDVRGGIDKLSGQVGYSAERVINAAQLGDCNIITAIKDCCCSQKELTQRMGYDTQLGLKDVSFNTERGFCALGRDLGERFDFLNRSVERGFSAASYEQQKQTCDIINAQNAGTQRIIDTLNNHWNTEQANKIQDLKFELSQERQNNFIAAKINTLNGGSCGCGCNTGCSSL